MLDFIILIIVIPLIFTVSIFAVVHYSDIGWSKAADILFAIGFIVAAFLALGGLISWAESARGGTETLEQLEVDKIDSPSRYSFMQNQGSDIFEKMTLGILNGHENTSPQKLGPAKVFGIFMLISFKFWLIVSAWVAIALVGFLILRKIFFRTPPHTFRILELRI